MQNLSNNQVKIFHRRLIEWYNCAFRDLPWRKTQDPYRIWISEVMLQQTQVNKVICYYENFMQKYPSIQALAAADLHDVLKAWEGLGYYARARNLKKAAEKIVEQHKGIFPPIFEDVRKLPGIGVYTAAAVLSIAFGAKIAVVDGNVRRVLARLLAIEKSHKTKEGEEIFAETAAGLLDEKDAGTYNQALMELGAIICRPVKPRCLECPLASLCQAFQKNEQSKFPVRMPAKKIPHYEIAAAIIRKDGEILIARRPENGLLGGLWEFPGGKRENGESLEQTAIREAREEVGIDIRIHSLFTIIRHQYSHFKITMHVFDSEYVDGNAQALGCTECKWVKEQDLKNFAFPRANGKILDRLYALKRQDDFWQDNENGF